MPDEGPPLRVHYVVHHHRDRAAGASGATLALGDALEALGCRVSYFFFEDAGLEAGASELRRMMQFPWRVAAHLARSVKEFDLVDATSGDAWLWCWQGRPGGTRTALVTRSHGLEHVTHDDLQRRAAIGEAGLSWKYPLYHGGLRLWEVRRSMSGADGQVFLNDSDRAYAIHRLGVHATTSVVIPNGVPERLLGLPRVTAATNASSPIALAFIGSWIQRKGVHALVRMTATLHARGVPFSLRILGTGIDRSQVINAFSPAVQGRLSVTPHYAPAHLPALLEGAEVLIHPSWTEGFSLALVEAMACGLAPIATRAGGAPAVVRNGETGTLLQDGSDSALADAVLELSNDRVALQRLRVAAQAEAGRLRWTSIAEETLTFYRSIIARRTTQGAARRSA